MFGFRKMLLIFRSDSDAIHWALNQAQQHQSRISIWQVLNLPSLDRRITKQVTAETELNLEQLTSEKLNRDLAELVATCDSLGSDVRTRVIHRDLKNELQGFLWNERPDVVIIPLVETSDFRGLLREIVGDLPIPILFLNSRLKQSNPNVLVVLDTIENVADSTLRFCTYLSRDFFDNVQFSFLHPIFDSGERYLEGRRGVATKALESVEKELASDHHQAVHAVLSQFGFGSNPFVVRKGNRTRVISEGVREASADIVIVNPDDLQRSIWNIIQTPLEQLLNVLNCSVLLTAPSRFIQERTD
ncbi:MAG: hypothetical protein U0930_02570 [Pirellulales bacterium]